MEMPPFEAIMNDPATTLVYMSAVSNAGETMGQTMIRNQDSVIGYQENVILTAGALLDGIHRNQDTTEDADTAEFIDDVMKELKQMEKEATYENHEIDSPN